MRESGLSVKSELRLHVNRSYGTSRSPGWVLVFTRRAGADDQPFSWKAAVLFILTGGGLYLYFDAEKQKLALKKRQSGYHLAHDVS